MTRNQYTLNVDQSSMLPKPQKNVPSSQPKKGLSSFLKYIVIIDHHQLPCDCKNGPEETVNLGDGPREDIADAVDGGHLGVVLQRLHQRAGLAHDHVFLLQLLDSNSSLVKVGVLLRGLKSVLFIHINFC